MKIKWLGHSSFLITSDSGIRIITDPYTPGIMGLNYGEIKESANIVTITHEHGDHNDVTAIQGKPEVVKNTGSTAVKGINFNGIASYHDNAGGSARGNNIIFCFEVDGIKVCHFGDLGHLLSDDQVAAIGKVDIVLTPVGGNFTIDAKAATEICNKLQPKVILPMHYQNDRCPGFPVAGVDEFLSGKENVIRRDSSEEEFNQAELPATTQIIVLQPAL